MTDSELKEIAEKEEDLFEDLANAFNDAGITVSVNKETGEIAMDSTVLFGGDSAELTDEGKEFLNNFIKAYTSIIYNEKYDGFISKTMVEGHIAPVSGTTYEGGLPLSEKRAENVKDYCLSSATGVDTSKLASTLETVGYSQSKPVYDSDGNVDIAGSRRVSFRFIINLDK
jgi:outer membrane protein OmpA-like peptidoglycan-associated protein